jgi:hypothetical protein
MSKWIVTKVEHANYEVFAENAEEAKKMVSDDKCMPLPSDNPLVRRFIGYKPTTLKGSISRTTIINRLISKFNYKSYLEIGVRDPDSNFNQINIENKEGVDPSPQKPVTHLMTSDAFFEKNKKKFDIIFIDGLHLDYQVDKDIKNSLNFLNDNGVIVMHDCNPCNELLQRDEFEINGQYLAWNGTVWKSFAKLRTTTEELEMCVVDTDHGVGIIRIGKQKKYPFDPQTEKLDFNFLDSNRVELLNLISVAEYQRKYNG